MKKDETRKIYIAFTILTALYFIIMISEQWYIFPFLNVIYIVWAAISIVYMKKKYDNSFKDIKEYEYYRDIDFKKISAVVSGILMHTEKVNVNTIITAIYELAEKNIIKIEWKEQKNFLRLEEHNKEEINNLLSYEKSIIKFIFKSPEDTNEYCLEDILKEAKEDSTKNYILKDIEKEIKNYINKKYTFNTTDYLNEIHNMSWAKIGSMLCVIILIFGLPQLLFGIFSIKDPMALTVVIEYLINLPIFIYYINGRTTEIIWTIFIHVRLFIP